MMNHIADLAPHVMCLYADPALVWVLAIGHVLTGIAYLVIPMSLTQLASKQLGVTRSRTRLIQIFVVACGLAHFAMVLSMFVGTWSYYLLALIVTIMALVSILTAIAFWRARSRFEST
jgi:hypothetical protein